MDSKVFLEYADYSPYDISSTEAVSNWNMPKIPTDTIFHFILDYQRIVVESGIKMENPNHYRVLNQPLFTVQAMSHRTQHPLSTGWDFSCSSQILHNWFSMESVMNKENSYITASLGQTSKPSWWLVFRSETMGQVFMQSVGKIGSAKCHCVQDKCDILLIQGREDRRPGDF